MRRFAQIIAVLVLVGAGLGGCADGGESGYEQNAGQGPNVPAGSGGGSGTGVTGGMGAAGASGMAGAAGMAMPSGGTSGNAGIGSGGSAGTGSGGSAGVGSGGSGGSAGVGSGGSGGSSGSGGSAGTGSGGSAGVGGEAGMEPPLPMPDYAPSPNNPPECPAVAPENPVGDCLGLPVYLTCEYGDDTYWYVCTCDWYHWLCAGT